MGFLAGSVLHTSPKNEKRMGNFFFSQRKEKKRRSSAMGEVEIFFLGHTVILRWDQ
jgi:hypothetical protein